MAGLTLPGDVDVAVCRVCGCTDDAACPGGCSWVTDPEGVGDLCSACTSRAHIQAAAAWAADQINAAGVARVRLTPGDMTTYEVIVVHGDVPEWEAGRETALHVHRVTLANDFGASYPWGGGEVHASYAAEKWTRLGTPPRRPIGEVMAAFLNALGPLIDPGFEGESPGDPLTATDPSGFDTRAEAGGDR